MRSCSLTAASREASSETSTEMAEASREREEARDWAVERVRHPAMARADRQRKVLISNAQRDRRTDGEAVLGAAEDVVGSGLSDKARSEEEDLLGGSSGGSGGSDLLGRIDDGLGELGEDEGGAVDVLVPVANVLDLAKGSAEVAGLVEGADDESDRARGVGGDRGVGELGDGEESAGHRHEIVDEGEVEPDALSLGGDASSGLEGLLEELEVGLLEEGRRGSNGVGRVGDDDVELGLLVVEELESVANVDRHARVVEASGHVREERLGDAGDSLVDVAKDGRLDGRVLEDLAKDSSISTANNEDGDGVGVGGEGKVGDHLLCRGYRG